MNRSDPTVHELGLEPEIVAALDGSADGGLLVFSGPTRGNRVPHQAAAAREMQDRSGGNLLVFGYARGIEYGFGLPPLRKGAMELHDLNGFRGADLRTALETDLPARPDVIAVDDVIDAEAMGALVGAASSGTGVVAAFAAGTVAEAAGRVISWGREAFPGSPALAAAMAVGSLRLVVAEVTLPGTDGQTVACREFVVLDEAMRVGLLRLPATETVHAIEHLMEQGRVGRTMKASAGLLLKQGLISEETFHSQAAARAAA